MGFERHDFKDLIGKTFTHVERVEAYNGDDILRFTADTGEVYEFYHDQDCCESVGINEIVGTLSDLEGHVLMRADEAVNTDNPPEDLYDYSHTWTFYNFTTTKGHVTVRWLGQSNGHYSERVSFRKVEGTPTFNDRYVPF